MVAEIGIRSACSVLSLSILCLADETLLTEAITATLVAINHGDIRYFPPARDPQHYPRNRLQISFLMLLSR